MYAGWQDANDCVGLSIHPNLFAEDFAVRCKITTPQSIAKDDYVIPAGLTFLRQEIAPQHERQSLHGKETWGSSRARDLFRALVGAHIKRGARPGSHALKR